MHILVTGGAGFIGSATVRLLLNGGHSVTVLDNESVGKLCYLPGHSSLWRQSGELGDWELARRCVQSQDAVLHLAAMTRIQASLERPVECLENNIIGTAALLHACRDAGVRKIVFASSSSVYGLTPPPHREDGPTDPLNPYALSKWAGERLLKYWVDAGYGDAICLRYFNVYGPGENEAGDYSTVIRRFRTLRLQGTPLTIYGDGEQRRDFTHVLDVAQANVLALTTNLPGHHIVNIGAGDNRSVNDVAALIGGPVVHLPARLGEAMETQADNSLARELLGWHPTVPFGKAIRDLIQADDQEGKP